MHFKPKNPGFIVSWFFNIFHSFSIDSFDRQFYLKYVSEISTERKVLKKAHLFQDVCVEI